VLAALGKTALLYAGCAGNFGSCVFAFATAFVIRFATAVDLRSHDVAVAGPQ
jgi:hypothetical protein